MPAVPHLRGSSTTAITPGECFRIGEWHYEPATGELRRSDTCLRLEPRTADVLTMLVHNAGRLVTRRELLDRVWSARVVTDESVTRAISRLRQVLDDTPPHRYIETLPKRGYRLNASVLFCEPDEQPRVTSRPGAAERSGLPA